ncbi:SigE family RNA polymerase sigma factor [Streptacidiphilus sp. ASG 303]|uniref:SigE family RNA polymerase sigma factor n=1 Tax=Streptacidiphilus sp. ASG 303 TaxID=2896847 RepID=UPI001E506E64|nr:SigE family RNA polymerase sigma factor [Streptacidiphilus sp. ASG 303]MCD0481843.1 SigE family RNA polymerase sigma factor [Streptacidiphilus sp. ASG 303]
MNATLQTRTASPVRSVRPSSGRRPVRADEAAGAVGVRGCVHQAAGDRLFGTGRRQPAADGTGGGTGAVALRGVLPAAADLPGGAGGQVQYLDRAGRGARGGAQGAFAPAAEPEVDHTEDFTAYVRERRASLYATAYHLTGDRHEAEDLLQTALFSTYRAWGRISDKAAVGGYLRRTMTNLHISAWRRRKVNEYPTEEMPEAAGDTDAMGGTELRAVLWQALAKLPEQQRTMLVLRYYEGRTDPEIADVLGISVGTVKSSIWRALRRLREDDTLNRGGDLARAFGELVA